MTNKIYSGDIVTLTAPYAVCIWRWRSRRQHLRHCHNGSFVRRHC
jgi:hypothetical protein